MASSTHEFEQTLGDSEGQGSLPAAVHEVTKSRTQLTTTYAVAKSTVKCMKNMLE